MRGFLIAPHGWEEATLSTSIRGFPARASRHSFFSDAPRHVALIPKTISIVIVFVIVVIVIIVVVIVIVVFREQGSYQRHMKKTACLRGTTGGA